MVMVGHVVTGVENVMFILDVHTVSQNLMATTEGSSSSSSVSTGVGRNVADQGSIQSRLQYSCGYRYFPAGDAGAARRVEGSAGGGSGEC